MKGSIHIGRFLGIPVGLHWSWFLVFLMVSWSLASGYFYIKSPTLPVDQRWVWGVVTSLLFFGSVLAHEFGHAVIALRSDVPVQSVTLFILGGVAHISREPRSAGAEFRIAIAGPLTSLALGVLFGLVSLVLPVNSTVGIGSRWLSQVNLVLAAFNMIPGFPLDGGRVLRAIIWWFSSSYERATRFASYSGQLVAIGFFGFGIYSLFGGDTFNGIWLGFLGWFLQSAARSSDNQSQAEKRLDGLKVENLMSIDVERVEGDTPIATIIDNQFLTSGYRYFVVDRSGHPQGLFSIMHLGRIPRSRWNETTAEQVMTPWDATTHVQPETGLLFALQVMEGKDLDMLPVLCDGEIAGILSHEHVHRFLKLQSPADR